ncbi:DNA polymerase III subunit gamma/tau [Mycoplasma tullyi]|uniref:DNA polymerase III subunit gamma/tau n=1 Tax=Mycoplasma tullyi TaxID=1612150 RepID=A0A7D7YEU9_9MOLU|nr:DNA polymerase III subunit gamma/tau [Mycoplasma tullyi]QMT98438.1 DNA polymerase III subunit gamma/tau [Mycoplasma tullyi]
MINFYQKYRPNNLSSIIGQSHITNILLKASANDQLATAYIFQGSRGIGKTSISKILAKAYNCLNKKDGDVCNQCSACELINENKSQDIYELDAATNNGVDEIRKIIDAINYAPINLSKKVYILDEGHMLSNGAWNALLKTLEEPPKHVVFIFATTEFHKIPLTVVSRCQSFNFKKLDRNDLVDVLNNVVKQEKIKIEDAAIDKIADFAAGSARDALSILQQLAYEKTKKITVDKINETFGLINLEVKLEFLELINQGDVEKLINLLNDIEAKGSNFVLFIQDVLAILIDLLVYQKTKKVSLLKVLNEEQVKTISLRNIKLLGLSEMINGLLSTRTLQSNIKESLLLAVFDYLEQNPIQQSSGNVEASNLKSSVTPEVTVKSKSVTKVKPIEESKELEKVEEVQPQIATKTEDKKEKVVKVDQADEQPKTKKTKNSSSKDEQVLPEPTPDTELDISLDPNKTKDYLMAIIFNVLKDKNLFNKELQQNFLNAQDKFKKGDNKEDSFYDNVDLYLTGSKVFMVTDKAAIVLLEDPNVEELINEQSYNNSKVHTINHIFDKEIYVFAVTEDVMKPIFKQTQKIKDLDIINYYNDLYESLDVNKLRTIKKQKTQAEILSELLDK